MMSLNISRVCSIAALQAAKLTIFFYIGVITNVNFAKKAITVAIVMGSIGLSGKIVG